MNYKSVVSLSIFTLLLAFLGPTLAFPAQVAVDTPSRAFPGVSNNHPMIQQLVAQLLEKIAKAESAEAQVGVDPMIKALIPHIQILEVAIGNYIENNLPAMPFEKIKVETIQALLPAAEKRLAVFTTAYPNQNILTRNMLPELMRQLVPNYINDLISTIKKIIENPTDTEKIRIIGKLKSHINQRIVAVNYRPFTQEEFDLIQNYAQSINQGNFSPLNLLLLTQQLIERQQRRLLRPNLIQTLPNAIQENIAPFLSQYTKYTKKFDQSTEPVLAQQEVKKKAAASAASLDEDDTPAPAIVPIEIDHSHAKEYETAFLIGLPHPPERTSIIDHCISGNGDVVLMLYQKFLGDWKDWKDDFSLTLYKRKNHSLRSIPLPNGNNSKRLFINWDGSEFGYTCLEQGDCNNGYYKPNKLYHTEAFIFNANTNTPRSFKFVDGADIMRHRYAVALSNNGNYLAAYSSDRKLLTCYDIRTGNPLYHPIQIHEGISLRFLSVNDDATIDLVWEYPQEIGGYQFVTFDERGYHSDLSDHLNRNGEGHIYPAIHAVSQCPHTKQYALSYMDETIEIVTKTGAVLATFKTSIKHTLLAYNANKLYLLLNGSPYGTLIYDTQTKKSIHSRCEGRSVTRHCLNPKLCNNGSQFLGWLGSEQWVLLSLNEQLSLPQAELLHDITATSQDWFRQKNLLLTGSQYRAKKTYKESTTPLTLTMGTRMHDAFISLNQDQLPLLMQHPVHIAQQSHHAGPGPSIHDKELPPTTPSYLQVLNNPTSKIACTLFALYCWRTGKLQLLIQRLQQLMPQLR